MLRIDRDRAAGELGERNAMTAACEAKDDAFVHEALALQALADAAVDEKIDRSLLQHAGADRGFDFLPAARFDHDRVDAAEMQQVREKKTGRPCADDNDLRFSCEARHHNVAREPSRRHKREHRRPVHAQPARGDAKCVAQHG